MKSFYCMLILFTAITALPSCFSLLGDGSNKFVKQSINKGHTKKVILFLREAGPTVADSYQVSIIDYKAEFDTSTVGNTFTVDDNHGKTRLNKNSINFRWLSNDSLQISYDKNLRTFIQGTKVENIVIIYKTE